VATGTSVRARFVRNIVGLSGPESVRYDAEADAFYVSNMAGYGSVKDGNGYIVRLSAANLNDARVLVAGGQGGAVLDAPKGMAVHGDTLWVCDIQALRGFDRRTGAPLATLDFAPQGAVLLNDVAVAPDGTLRVTDTGINMSPAGVIHTGPDRIFSVGPAGRVATVDSAAAVKMPNGITWDSAGRRWLVVSFDPWQGEVVSTAADGAARRVLRTGGGHVAGVVALADGGVLFTSWADSSVHLLAGGRDERLVRGVPEAADIGVDTRRRRLAIPLATLDRVQLWSLPAAGPAAVAAKPR
jgi:sugar lactone lactonase YvrE